MVRHKNRYIVVLITENDTNATKKLHLKPITLSNAIKDTVQQLYGDFGLAAIKAAFTAKYCNELTKIAIIKVRHGPHRFVTSVLPLITSLENKSITINIIHIGATIKQSFKFILEYQERKYYEFVANLKRDEDKKALRESLMDIDDVLTIV
ncbi:ribonuclease P/MRP protein subunit POP5 [Onthophagus taurus]|uniref:ribonuclease P/MRP protein subunit POP5 n=1 Tax=Onthophagus taurus TaxID=166361 RepID=UPI000C206B74|nr:ribonuclease P/MRP protein subunit POP5 [Onthophagus taurus]